jgi:hypothetical protein
LSVRTECLPFQDRFQPLYAFASPARNQPVNRMAQAAQVAQPFKIVGWIFRQSGAHVA